MQKSSGFPKSTASAIPVLSRARDRLSSVGDPIDGATRTEMEARLGHSFSDVRIHVNDPAARANEALGSAAFTTRENIAFGRGQYEPHTSPGFGLLAHELVHVVQQRTSRHAGAVGHPDDEFEQQANRIQHAVTANQPVPDLEPGLGGLGAASSTAVAPALQCATPPETASVAGEATPEVQQPEVPQQNAPLVIGASVGRACENRPEDVAKVQARLLALGLLSEAAYAAELPAQPVTPAVTMDETAADAATPPSPPPEAAPAEPTVAEPTASTPAAESAPVESGAATPAAAEPAAAEPSVPEVAPLTPIGAAPTAAVQVLESSMPATLEAIREFQQCRFSRENVDQAIDAEGKTWTSLSTIDAAGFAKMKEAWQAKRAQMEAERAQREKEEAERKRKEEYERSEAAAKERTTKIDALFAQYATYLGSTYVSLDEHGLAGSLAGYAKSDPKLVLQAFDELSGSDTDDVAFEMVSAATDENLAGFDPGVLGRLKAAMTG
ncbi:MAG: DUF4157 domain-containing protein, partial [Verrucomicrobiales bacterium]|nr:DUF4157 domain-containing protein [Verrucomicrobiales bacterium]